MDQAAERKEKLRNAIIALSLELEIHEGRRFDIKKGISQVIKVLNFSLESRVPEVKQALVSVLKHMTPQHKKSLASKGVRFAEEQLEDVDSNHSDAQKIVYRGQEIEKPVSEKEPSAPEKELSEVEEDSEHKGKKKIIYRGQEKWV